jgi:uracil-DNA glycosylase
MAITRDLFGGADPAALSVPLARCFDALPSDWQALAPRFLASSMKTELCATVDARRAAGATIYPPQPFATLHELDPAAARVVVLGQDPYHGAGQAQGRAFSVPVGMKLPPSLRNIYAEISREFGTPLPGSGDLSRWVQQGVLLLNTVLTVEDGAAASHTALGWETFTDELIGSLGQQSRPLAFLLWGAPAQKKRVLIGPQHLVLCANHPSPLSARRPPVPFIGCGHFGQVNTWLISRGEAPINW